MYDYTNLLWTIKYHNTKITHGKCLCLENRRPFYSTRVELTSVRPVAYRSWMTSV